MWNFYSIANDWIQSVKLELASLIQSMSFALKVSLTSESPYSKSQATTFKPAAHKVLSSLESWWL